MVNSEISKVVFIGAGKMALSLGYALHTKGLKIIQVYNRTAGNGETLAKFLRAEYIADPNEITTDADLYILAVSDSCIEEISARFCFQGKFVVHTSGAVDINVLQLASKNHGVFYPLQSFTNFQQIDFKNIPLCLEANTTENFELLFNLAKKLSSLVYPIDSNLRRKLHLAAVFASNFSNFMYVIAEEILKSNKLSPDLIVPLIRLSSQVGFGGDFFQRQTGPAVRGDHAIIARHEELLAGNSDYLEIYDLITNNIIKYKSQHG